MCCRWCDYSIYADNHNANDIILYLTVKNCIQVSWRLRYAPTHWCTPNADKTTFLGGIACWHMFMWCKINHMYPKEEFNEDINKLEGSFNTLIFIKCQLKAPAVIPIYVQVLCGVSSMYCVPRVRHRAVCQFFTDRQTRQEVVSQP